MRKTIAIVLLIALCACFAPLPAAAESAVAPPSVSAKAAVLMEAGTGRVLYAVNDREHLAMASTTKIMTALLTLEAGDPDTFFTVDPDAIRVEGSSMGLVEGDQVTRRSLSYGMLLPSGNDAANAGAVSVAGSVPAFVELMNARARKIGMVDTLFVTPSGLDGEGHASTAYDMALLTREALRNDTFREICSARSVQVEFGNPPYLRWLSNSNKMLKYYDGAMGVKTGFTDRAGRCLVSAAERNGVRLIAVTLNAPDDWNDHTKMLDYGFATVKPLPLSYDDSAWKLPVAGSQDTEQSIGLKAVGSPTACVPEEEVASVQTRLLVPAFVYAPVAAGDEVGALQFVWNGTVVYEAPLIAVQDAPAYLPPAKTSPLESLARFFKGLFGGT